MISRATRLLVCAGIALAAAGFFWYQAQEVIEVPVIRTSQTSPQLASRLGVGDILEQSLEVPEGYYTGVVLYSRSPAWLNQRLTVALHDSKGNLLSQSSGVEVSYDKDGLLRLEFPMQRFFIRENDRGKVTIQNYSQPLVLLAVTPDRKDIHVPGNLYRNGQDRKRVLALSMRQSTPMSDAAKQGSLAAIVFFVGVAVIETLVPERWRWWLYTALLAVMVAIALPGFWFSQRFLGIADWDYYFSLHTYYRNIILNYHQFPWWNPYTCGGTAGLGDPEFPGFTITFLLELLFGIPLGIRLAIYATAFIGATGMLYLGKRLKLSPLASLVAAVIATFGTVTLLEIVEGHVNVMASMWIPWIFFAWHGAYQKQKDAPRTPWWMVPLNGWTVLCAIFLAITFYAGGVYLLMYTGLAFVLLWLFAARHTDAVRITIAAGLLALGLASFKLVPVLNWLGEFPDQAYASSTTTMPWIVDILLGRHLHGEYILFGQDSGWHEYGAFVGAAAVGLALVGATVYRRRRVVQALLVATMAGILLSSTGPALRPFFDLLWFFPRSNISRIILFAVIPLSFLAGFGIQYFERRRPRSVWPLAAAGLVTLELLTLVGPLSYQAFVLPRVYPSIAPATSPLQFTSLRFDGDGAGSRTTRAYAAAEAGYGTFSYCSVLGPSTSAVRTVEDEEDNGPVWIEDRRGTVELLEWTPNRVRFKVASSVPTKVGLNTNYALGWWVGNVQAVEIGNRVGLPVEAGERELVFEYKTPGVQLGSAITLSTLFALGGWVWMRRKKKSI